MNRDEKAAAVAEIAAQIQESEAVFAVDYRGISVTQAAELRGRLRDADATFRIVKNTLTERAADEAGADGLKSLLDGPTALTFVRGDAAVAAKALRDYARTTNELLPSRAACWGRSRSTRTRSARSRRLPARDVLYGQLVGVVASPITGLARSLGGLVGGLAIALGGVLEKKESGDLPAATRRPQRRRAGGRASPRRAHAAEPEEAPAAAEATTTETETQED